MEENDEILDQEETLKPYNKNTLLYVLSTVFLIGIMFRQMHWPGSSLLVIFGGGACIGYSLGLLVYYRFHFWFENLGLIMYSGGVSFFVINNYNSMGWLLYGCTVVIGAVITSLLLRNKEIN